MSHGRHLSDAPTPMSLRNISAWQRLEVGTGCHLEPLRYGAIRLGVVGELDRYVARRRPPFYSRRYP